MIKKLLILSLIAIPFYEVFLYFLISGRGYPAFPDLRVTKDFIMLASCLTIGSVVLCTEGFSKVKNIWIPAFIIFLIWNIYKSPDVYITIMGSNINRMWNWEPVVKILSLFILFLGVSSTKFSNKDIQDIFKTIAGCGLVMAIYMLLQKIGIDQIYDTFPVSVIGHPNNPSMGGTIGQATLSAPFIVMCLPFMVYFNKFLACLLMALTVFLSGSSFAILGLASIIFTFIFLQADTYSKKIFVTFFSLLIALGLYFTIHKYFPNMLVANGRFGIWQQTFTQFLNHKIEFTGAGIGAYKYLFALKNNNTWYQAHNEYLQLLWSCGLIGFSIAFMAVKNFIHELIIPHEERTKVILLSFVGVGAVALGSFPLQLAVYQFYLVVMAGIVYSILANKEVYYGRS